MKFWLDTEFMEDGAEYYAVNADADVSRANDWFKEHVLPHLDFTLSKPKDKRVLY